jgi:hypothetical protein
VQPGWHEGDAAVMDRATYQRHKDAFLEGTRVLFYMKEPVDALVGEAEVTGEVVHATDESDEPILDPAIPASLRAQELMRKIEAGSEPLVGSQRFDQRTYRLPYHMIRSRISTPYIHLGTIKARIGSDFGVFDDEWIPLTEEQYNALVHEWESRIS